MDTEQKVREIIVDELLAEEIAKRGEATCIARDIVETIRNNGIKLVFDVPQYRQDAATGSTP